MGIILNTKSEDMFPFNLSKDHKLFLTGMRFEIEECIYLSIMDGNVINNIKLNTADLSMESYAFKCTKNIDKLNWDMQYGMMSVAGVKKENLFFDLNDFLMKLAKSDFV